MGNTSYTIHHWATGNQYVVTWASMSSTSGSMDVGEIFPATRDLALGSGLFSDKSVQVIRGGGDIQVLIEGSNQATPTAAATTAFTFASLTDPQGNALQLPPSGQNVALEAILENVVYIRPRVTTTTFPGTNPATVHLLLSSVRSSRSGV